MPLIINYSCSEVDFMAMFDVRICLSLVHVDGFEVSDTWSSLLSPASMSAQELSLCSSLSGQWFWKRGIPGQSDLLPTHSMSSGRTLQTFLGIIWISKLDFRNWFPSWASFPLVLSTWESSKSDLLAPSHAFCFTLSCHSHRSKSRCW